MTSAPDAVAFFLRAPLVNDTPFAAAYRELNVAGLMFAVWPIVELTPYFEGRLFIRVQPPLRDEARP